MNRGAYLGTALMSVVIVALPVVSSPSFGLYGVFDSESTQTNSDSIANGQATQSDDLIATLIAAAEAASAADANAGSTSNPDASSSSTSSAESQEPGAPRTTGTDLRGATTSTGGGAASSGSTSGGATGGEQTAPPPPPPAPEPPACPSAIGGSTPGAPSRTSALGVAGTSSGDLQAFAERYNAIRVANCLAPVPFSNIRYDSCMEDRLFWMAEDPSDDPMSAWGHIGSQRSDGVPSVGCDGNLAGGSGNTGATVAQKWWDSSGHRTSLYKPTVTGSVSGVCILFAMTHGGVPNEPQSFTRSAARWINC